MPQRDCPILLNGCPGVDAPITNISAEAPDIFQWAAQIWSPWDPYRPPRLGDGQEVKVDCNSLAAQVFSSFDPIVFSESQAMANLLALGATLGCPWNIPETSGVILQNDAQSATVTCPDGSSFTFEVPAGIYSIDAAILCGYPTDTVIFISPSGTSSTVQHPGCFVAFTADQLSSGGNNSTATWRCVDGHTFTTTIAGYTTAASKACQAWIDMANQWAQAEAFAQATNLLDCVTKDDPDGPGNDPPVPLGPGPGILTRPSWICLGEEFFSSYNISGRGSAGYTIELVSGVLPPGTTFQQTGPRRATLSGTPMTAGAYTFTMRGTSTVLPFSVVEATDTVYVFGLVSDVLPDAETGTAYSEVLSAAGGTAPYTFALDPSSDPMPGGLTLASDGTVSGTPTETGDFLFDVIVTDSQGGECTQTVSLTVGVGLNPTAWWTMELGGPVPPISDVINSIPLNHVSGNTALYTKEAGIVAQSWQLRNAGTGASAAVGTPGAPTYLNMTDEGVTIAWWMYYNSDLFGSLGAVMLRYSFQVGATPHSMLVAQWPTKLEVQFDFVEVLALPILSQNAWHFIAFKLDRSTDTLSVQVDNGTVYSAILAPMPLGPYSNSSLLLTVDQNGGGAVFANGRFDELGFFQEPLTAGQLDSLYNGGMGRTWP